MLKDLILQGYTSPIIYDKGQHIVIRCPFCGDSVKNYRHAHLYIEPELKVFWCARCYTSGTLKYLLHVIKDRFSPMYYTTIKEVLKKNYHNRNTEDYHNKHILYKLDSQNSNDNLYYFDILNIKLKLATKTEKEIEILQNFFLSKYNIYLEPEKIISLPIFISNDKLTKLHKLYENLTNCLCWLTLSDYIFCRHIKNTRKFRTVKLLDLFIQNNQDNKYIARNRCTIFSFTKQKLDKYNHAYKKIKKFIIAEGLSDLLAYHVDNYVNHDNTIQEYYISTNGKYKDDIYYIIDSIGDKNYDEFVFLIDNDAKQYEIEFIRELGVKNYRILIPVGGNDYRTADYVIQL